MSIVRNTTFLLLLNATTLSAQTTVTLNQARQAALANSPNTTDKQLYLNAGELRSKTIGDSWLPQVKGVAEGTYQSEVTEFDLSALGFPAITISKDQYHAGFEVQQTIYEFGATHAQRELALTAAQAQAAGSDVALLNVTRQTDQLYASVLQQQSGLEILRSRAADLNAQLAQVSSAVRNGVSLRSNEEVLKAEALTTQQQIVTTASALAHTVSALSILTGTPMDTTMTFVLPPAPAPMGMGTRPEQRAFALQQSSKDLQAKLIRKQNLPHLGAFGNGYYGRPGFNFLNNDFRSYAIVGVGINWNIAGYYTQNKELQVNTIQQKLIDDRNRDFELQQATDLDKEDKEIAKLDQLTQLDSGIVASKTFVREAASSQLENGVITAQDYVIYQNAQDQAKLNLELHRIQAVMARIDHLLTQGN